jgi:hypothetical protein
MSERRIQVGKNVAGILTDLQRIVAAAQRDLDVALSVLGHVHDLPSGAKPVSIEGDTLVVSIPDGE